MELDLGGYGKKIKGTFNDVGNTVTAGTGLIGNRVAGGANLVGKTAKMGVQIVGKTEIGGTLRGGATLIGGRLQDGTKIVGSTGKFITGTLADGTKILGNTVMMGTGLVAGGIHQLLGDGGLNDDVFFENDPRDKETFDDDFDGFLPTRFQKTENPQPKRDSMIVEWDDFDWEKVSGDPAYVPRISINKTVSQKEMEALMEEKKEDEEEMEDSEPSDDDEDIYFNEEELRAKVEEDKKRAQKRKKRSKNKRADENDGSDSSDDEFGALGKTLLAAYEHGRAPEDGSQPSAPVGYGSPLQDASVGAARMSMFSSMLSNTNNVNQNPLATGQKRAPLPPFEGTDESREITGGSTSNHETDIQRKTRVKGLWAKLRNHVQVNTLTSTMKKNQEFFSVFDEDEEQNADPVQAAAKTLRDERAAEKQRIKQLLTQLDVYEASLAEERKTVKVERARVTTEKEELESQLRQELEMNEALEKELREIEAELNPELQAERELVVQRQLEELRAENDVIQKQLATQDTTLRQLHREKAIRDKKEKQRESYGGYQLRQEMRSSGTLSTGSIILDDDMTVATYLTRSRSSTNMKMMQGDLAEMNDELGARHKIIEMQVTEMEQLRKELHDFEEANGIKPIKEKLRSLQDEKKALEENCTVENAELRKELEDKEQTATRYTAEISKLKLEQTKRELKSSKETEAAAEQTVAGGGGIFGWFGGCGPVDDADDADLALSKLGL
jgi:DNA repair exonuclease SbcCD ATPase subunit